MEPTPLVSENGEVRPMSADERAQREVDLAEWDAKANAALEVAAIRESAIRKLVGLGLTEDEARAVVPA